MDRLSVVVAAMVVAMALAVTVILVAYGTPAARIGAEDIEWTLRLHEADAALAAGDGQTAMAHLRAAHRAALRTGRWEALAEVGDAARRARELAPPPPRAFATASRAYLAGLARAREQQSVKGVLRVAEGFAALDDGQMVEYCIGVAGQLATSAPNEEPIALVDAFVQRYHETQAQDGDGLRK